MTTATRRCCGCKDRFKADSMIRLPVGYFHSVDCSIEYANRKRSEATRKAAKVVKASNAKQKRLFKVNDVQKQLKLTEKAFNKLRKLQEFKWFVDRGLEPECISCGKTHMDWCCGHFKTVGGSGALRFSERNTFIQCNKYCNSSKSGNIEGCKNTRGFKAGLVERFGYEGAENIKWLEANQSQIKRWTGEELKGMRKKFNEQIRGLESSGVV